MQSLKSRLSYSGLFLAMAAWLGAAGYSAADSPTPGTGNAPSSTGQQPSFPKQKDVSPFDPGTAAVIQKSSNASAALQNAKIQPGIKVGASPGPIQNGLKGVKPPGPNGKLGKGNLFSKGALGGMKGGKSPGPTGKLNQGALNGGSDMSANNQHKLQQAMDKKGQFENTLSNTMKANDAAQRGVAGNLK